MWSRSCLVAVLALLTLTCTAAAQTQDATRRRALGRALLRDAKPWANATITLVGSPYPGYWQFGPADTVTTTSDDRGRFEVALQPWRHYSAWAHAALPDGGFRISEILERVVPATEAVLRERELPQVAIQLRLVDDGGGEQPFGPLTFQLLCRAPRNVHALPLRLDEKGCVTLPALPGASVQFEAVTASGVRVWMSTLPLTAPRREALRQRNLAGDHEIPADDLGISIVHLPRASPIRFVVRDGADKPVPDADLRIGAQSSMGSIGDVLDLRSIARTGADGEAVVPLYLRWDEVGRRTTPAPDFAVIASGLAERQAPMLRDVGENGGQIHREAATARIRLERAGCNVTGRLMRGPNEPAANVHLLVYAQSASGGGTTISSRPVGFRTDDAGRFHIPSRDAQLAWRLTALLPVDSPTAREEHWLAARASGGLALGDIDIGSFASLRLTIADGGGVPLDRAEVYVGEESAGPPTPMTFLTDRVGRCTVRVPRGKRFLVFAAHESGFGTGAIDSGDGAPVDLELRVQAASWIAGRAVDPEGKPLQRARIRLNSSRHPDGGVPLHRFVQDVSSTTMALDYRLIHTDAEGRFRVPMPHLGVTVQVSAWLDASDGTYWQLQGNGPTVELGDSEPPPLELVLHRR